MNIRPLDDRLLVKFIETGEKKKGGIIIPDSAKEKPEEGKVVALGAGKLLKDGKRKIFDVKKGEKVLFAKYAGTEVSLEGEKHLILKEEDILAVID